MKNPIALVLLSGFLLTTCLVGSGSNASDAEPVDCVYPLLDTENSRWFYFSSACRPFGMVNLSPDTEVDGAWGSGYRYNTEEIKGFSHIHAWQLSGLSMMPVTFSSGQEPTVFENYYSPFHHETERVSPGYHRLYLDRFAVEAELTSTHRVGFHRYHFSATEKAGIVVNLSGPLGPSRISGGRLESVSKFELQGSFVNEPTIRRSKAIRVFYVIQFDHEVVESLDRSEPDVTERVLFTFKDVDATKPVLMKVGISYTSMENARRNIELELPGWDFDQVVEDSKQEWNDALSRIEIKGGSQQQRGRFYTDLWHALQGRRTISDAEGYYPDYTGDAFRIRQVPLNADGTPAHRHFNSDSFWGAQWTLNTLWHLVYPDISLEFVKSLLLYYQDGGLVPRGPSGGNYTYVMTGASSTPFIVSAWMKGIRGFDPEMAYEGCRKNHFPGGMMSKAGYEHHTSQGGGLEFYLAHGYVPDPNPEGEFGFHQGGGSLTLEYAYQDWALAQFAKALGNEKDFVAFLDRSQNWKNVIDPSIGWARPRDEGGAWKDPYDPFTYKDGFNEANGAQMTWFVPHDPEGLAEILGGRESAVAKLNQVFEIAEKQEFTSGTSHAAEEHPENRRIPINYGNQPSIQTAFLFSKWGRPDLTQYWSGRIVDQVYSHLEPGRGYNGDEDQGLMGSLAVLMKMGLFELDGGVSLDPNYQLTPPLFDEIRIQLDPTQLNKNVLVIRKIKHCESARRNAVFFKGEALEDWNIPHHLVRKGGVLEYRSEAMSALSGGNFGQ